MMRGGQVLGKVCKSGGNINAQYAPWNTLVETEVETAGQAVEWLHKSSKKLQRGTPAAQYVLGKLYQDGVYFNKDMDQAMKWFRAAAELGEMNMLHIGWDVCCFWGENTEGCGSGCEVAQPVSGKKEIHMRSIGLECYISRGKCFSPQVEVANEMSFNRQRSRK